MLLNKLQYLFLHRIKNKQQMERTKFNQYVSTCLEAKRQGMDYTEIHKSLTQEGLDESDIKQIVRETDDRFLKDLNQKSKSKKGKALLMGAWAFLFLGGFITLGSYLQWFDTKGLIIISYGPFMAGLILYLTGRAMGGKL